MNQKVPISCALHDAHHGLGPERLVIRAGMVGPRLSACTAGVLTLDAIGGPTRACFRGVCRTRHLAMRQFERDKHGTTAAAKIRKLHGLRLSRFHVEPK